MLPLPILPPQGKDSSHSAPAPAWGPSHRRQSFMNCSSLCAPWGHKFCQKTCSCMSSLRGLTGPTRSLLHCGLPIGSQLPMGIQLLWRGVLHGMQVVICSTVDLHGLQGHSLPHHGLLHSLQGNLYSSTWRTSSPSFFTDLHVCRVLTPLSGCNMPLHIFFFLLNFVIPEALPPSPMGLAPVIEIQIKLLHL